MVGVSHIGGDYTARDFSSMRGTPRDTSCPDVGAEFDEPLSSEVVEIELQSILKANSVSRTWHRYLTQPFIDARCRRVATCIARPPRKDDRAQRLPLRGRPRASPSLAAPACAGTTRMGSAENWTTLAVARKSLRERHKDDLDDLDELLSRLHTLALQAPLLGSCTPHLRIR